MIIFKVILIAIIFGFINYSFYQIGRESMRYDLHKKLNERRYK